MTVSSTGIGGQRSKSLSKIIWELGNGVDVDKVVGLFEADGVRNELKA